MDTINRYLDAAVLKPELTRAEARDAILDCIRYRTRTVCVRPCDLDLAVELCRGSETAAGCVLAFPHGAACPETKNQEARLYIGKGVREIDMVANYGLIRSGEWALVEADIRAVSNETRPAGVVLKVILETCFLTADQIARSTEAAIRAEADYVKTSTGFASGGATVEAVRSLLESARGRIRVKASGGIRDYATARMYLDMGVQRLGSNYTSNAAICDGRAGAASESY